MAHQFLGPIKDLIKQQSWNIAGQKLQNILNQNPNHAEACHLMGVTCLHLNHTAVASQWLYKAVQLEPGNRDFRLQLAECYRLMGEHNKAIHYYCQMADQQNTDIMLRLAETYLANNQASLAIKTLKKAILQQPDLLAAYFLLGNLYSKNNPTESITCFKMALDLAPQSAEAHFNLGNAYVAVQQVNQAITCFQSAININPQFAQAQLNLGLLFYQLAEYDKALKHYQNALQHQPNFAKVHYALGSLYLEKQEYELGCEQLKKAYESEPENSIYLSSYSHALQHLCDWSRLQPLRQALLEGLSTRPLSTLFYALSQTDDNALIQQIAQANAQLLSTSRLQLEKKFPITAKHKIRIGYVSSDFKNHPTTHLLKGLFRTHNPDQFVIIAYAQLHTPDDADTQSILSYCRQVTDITQLSDEQCAKQIQADQIDILIDLNGHTLNNRLGIFALKPAPIQATYLGCPATTGLDTIDYIITDEIVTPPETQPFYSEKLAYLPHTYQATDDQQSISTKPLTKAQLGLPDKGIIFACFNQLYKVDETIFNVWLDILNHVNNSVLWLYSNNTIAQENLRKHAKHNNIDPNRLIFANSTNRTEHLQRQRYADIMLDTRLYNGHTTTSEALWMGVPVITLQGKSFASRVASSLLTAIGLTETITHDLAEYQALAISLAQDKAKRLSYRQRLVDNQKQTPLFQTIQFTKALERLYQQWIQYKLDE